MSAGIDRRKALLMLAGSAAGPLLSGCSSAKSSPAGSTALPVVRWGFFRNFQPVYVGVEKGFFREAGVDVQLTGSFNSGPAVVQAAGTGQLDAGHSAITGIAEAAAAGVKVAGVADSQTEFGDAPLQQWFVRNDSPIKTAADLRGKKIGTNALSGSFYYTALIALGKAGLTKDDVQFVLLPHERQGQALLSRQIDVAGIIDPYSVQLAKDSSARLLFTGATVLGERQFSLVFFTRDFIQKSPKAVRGFLTGYRKTIQFMHDNPAEATTIMASRLGLQPSDMVSHRYTTDALVRPADVQFWVDTMREYGELKTAPHLSAADILDLTFNA
ncbi:ABC transporter substrate-binding protein [Catenulispora subtropica]|uniref:ABC transporter substrate-binding protein n=1 Tax=Catenulispora subtropica TaxID=450798 RepID=A0ABN2SME3_9ACTN